MGFLTNLKVVLCDRERRNVLSTFKEMWRVNKVDFRLTTMPTTIEFRALKQLSERKEYNTECNRLMGHFI